MSRFSKKFGFLSATFVAGMLVVAANAQAGSVDWETSYESARTSAQKEGKPILAMFTASWCGPCQRMKSSTLKNSSVEREINEKFVPLMIDVDANRSVSRKFGVSAMPTFAVIDPVTEDAEKSRGYMGSSQFLSYLERNAPADIQLAASEKVEIKEGEGQELTEFCLVSAVEEGRLVEGDSEISSTKNGYTVYFASEEYKKKFDKNFEKYWPQLSGNCPVHLAEDGELERGKVRWVIRYDGKLYMCDSKTHAEKFIESPAKYIREASRRTAAVSRSELPRS